MPDISVKPGPADILATLGENTYSDAYSRGMSLSAYLNTLMDPTEYKDGLDGFGRLLKTANIKIYSDPELGIQADKFESILGEENLRALAPELVSRFWRRAVYGNHTRASGAYLSQDDILNTWAKPYYDVPGPRRQSLPEPAIPLSELVAVTTGIDADAYRAYYLTNPEAEDTRMKRVAEGGGFQTAKLVGGEQTIRLRKFGRALEVSYEQLRRTRFDKLAFHIAQLAVQAENDKLAAAIDVIVNGDGNSNSATSYNLTTLDSSAAAGTLTVKGWLAFKMKFANPYTVTTALVQEAVALQLTMLNIGTANIPIAAWQPPVGIGGFSFINKNLADSVRMGVTTNAPALKIVGLDRTMCLERVYEVGANLQETAKYVHNQTQLLTFSEIEGFAIMDKGAARVLDVNA